MVQKKKEKAFLSIPLLIPLINTSRPVTYLYKLNPAPQEASKYFNTINNKAGGHSKTVLTTGRLPILITTAIAINAFLKFAHLPDSLRVGRHIHLENNNNNNNPQPHTLQDSHWPTNISFPRTHIRKESHLSFTRIPFNAPLLRLEGPPPPRASVRFLPGRRSPWLRPRLAHLRPDHHDLRQLDDIGAHRVEDVLQLVNDRNQRLHGGGGGGCSQRRRERRQSARQQ